MTDSGYTVAIAAAGGVRPPRATARRAHPLVDLISALVRRKESTCVRAANITKVSY